MGVEPSTSTVPRRRAAVCSGRSARRPSMDRMRAATDKTAMDVFANETAVQPNAETTRTLTSLPPPAPGGLPPRRRWLAMTGIGLGVLMSTIDFSIVNISLPTLVKELNSNLSTVQWTILSYALVVTSLMLSVARLGDMFGKKRIYVIGLLLFSLGSLLCGMAPGIGWLIGFRAFQGLGAVMMQALGAAIVTEIFPSTERGRALGVIGGIVSFGLAVGPALGGVLISFAGWQSIFLINVPIGVIAGIVVTLASPAGRSRKAGERFDIAGAMILLIALSCYSLGMTFGQRLGFYHHTVLILLGVAVASLLLFFVLEWRLQQPMIDPRMFGNILLSLNILMGLLVFISLAGMVVLPFFLENVKGFSTMTAGLLMMVIPLSMGLVAPWAGALSDRHGPRGISLLGAVIMCVGCVAVSTVHAGVTLSGYILRIMPVGIGLGLFQSPNNSAVMGAVPAHRLGVASGLLSLSRNLGTASGLPLFSTLFMSQLIAVSQLPAAQVSAANSSSASVVRGVALTYQVAALIVLAAAVLAAAAFWVDRGRLKKSEK